MVSAVLVLLAGVLILFWPMLPPLITAWMEDPESSHCFLIPLVSGYLIWLKRGELAGGEWEESGLGFAVFIGGILLYGISYIGGIDIGQRIALTTVINGLVLYNLGFPAYRKILFPMLFLYLMAPIPITVMGLISFPLQLFATTLSKYLLLHIGIPVIQAGNILHTPRGPLEIAEACSGIRSLVSYLALSLFLAYWNKGKWKTSAILILSTVPIALGANVLRITFTAVIGVVYGMKFASGFLHEFSGFVLFFFGLVIFMCEEYWLRVHFDTPGIQSEKT